MLRFTPSPTSDMNISDLRIAILNYLTSQQRNEQFLIRIEDTDSTKNIEGKDTEIMMILEKFALKHNSVFHQSQHLNLYQTLALQLLKEEKAFVCKCTEDDNENALCTKNCETLSQKDYNSLKKSAEKFLVRIKGETKSKKNSMDAFVILKADGMPSYNFACATDDMMSNISFIIREDKHLLNTPKQIHIKKLLGYEDETSYLHLPSILNHDKYSLQWLLEEGFIPDAITNYLLLLGYKDIPKEIFTLPEAIEWFDLNKISKLPLGFELSKLRFINREHLKRMDDRQLSTLFGFADSDIGRLAKVYLEIYSTTKELKEKIHTIFGEKDFSVKEGKEMKILVDIIAKAPYFETFAKLQEHLSRQSGLEEEKLLKALKYLITGSQNGPELSEVYPFIKSYILEVAS